MSPTRQKNVFIVVALVLIAFCAVAVGMGNATEKIVPKAADFTLKDLKGNNVTLSSFRGKQVLITFGAIWCPYCVKEVPELNAFFDKHQDKDVKVLSVDINESADKVASFAKKHNVKYTILLDSDGEVAKKYEVYGIPAIFLIDKDGIIKYSGAGSPEGGFEALLK